MPLDLTYLPVSDGSNDAALMHISADRLIGSTTIQVDTVAGVPSKFIAITGTLLPPDANGNSFIDPTTITKFYGQLDGTDLQIDGFLPSTPDAGNTLGQVVVIKPMTEWADLVANTLFEFPGENIVNNSIGAEKLAAVLTANTGSLSWNNAKISGLVSTIRMGSASSGVVETFMTVDLSSLAIPEDAVILQYHFYFNPASNSGSVGGVGAQVTVITRSVGVHSVGLLGQWAINDPTAANLTNSKVQGFIRYIP